MKRSSRENSSLLSCRNHRINSKRAFTLAELLITTSILGIVLTSVCGIFFSVSKEWERLQGEAEALAVTSLACSRLADYISQATGFTLESRFTTNDTLLLNMPADKISDIYIPTWSGGKVQYRSGVWLVFYLSDSTGSVFRTGNILWGGTITGGGYPFGVNPDTNWSLYYNTVRGQIAPLVSIRFSVDSSGIRPSITMQTVARYKTGSTYEQITQSRTVCLRNAN